MKQPINPESIAAPESGYHHAVRLAGVSDLLVLSGQLGVRPDGSCETTAEAQSRQAWSNVKTILGSGGVGLADIVKVTSYVVGEENMRAYVSVHQEILGDAKPPWTLLVVAALGRPDCLVEVDVLAARSGPAQ